MPRTHGQSAPCPNGHTPHAVRYAIFDLDGTLHPDTLGILLLRDLHTARIALRRPVERLFEFLASLDQERLHEPDRVVMAYRLFAEALRGCDLGEVRDRARLLWERERDRVFSYAAPLLAALRAQGTTLVLVSGSPDEVVEQAARQLRFHRWRGAVLASRNGTYTGRYLHAPAAPGEKLALAAELVGGEGNFASCAAVGNSSTDIELLANVGHPVAFEAGPGLAAAARRHGWPVADRHTLTAAVLGVPPRPGPRPSPSPASCCRDSGEWSV